MKVFILFLFLLSSCGLMDQKQLPSFNTKDTYKATLKFKVNGKKYEGIGVIPLADQYEFEVEPEGKIDRIIWSTCTGEEIIDKPKTGWFNRKYSFTVKHINKLEDESTCGSLNITVLEEKKRRNAFGFAEFKDRRPEFKQQGLLKCNMKQNFVEGVAVCQSAAGLYQQISFPNPVVHTGANEGCDVIEHKVDKTFLFKIAPDICTYIFTAQEKSPNGKRIKLRLSTRGYTDAPPMKNL